MHRKERAVADECVSLRSRRRRARARAPSRAETARRKKQHGDGHCHDAASAISGPPAPAEAFFTNPTRSRAASVHPYRDEVPAALRPQPEARLSPAGPAPDRPHPIADGLVSAHLLVDSAADEEVLAVCDGPRSAGRSPAAPGRFRTMAESTCGRKNFSQKVSARTSVRSVKRSDLARAAAAIAEGRPGERGTVSASVKSSHSAAPARPTPCGWRGFPHPGPRRASS